MTPRSGQAGRGGGAEILDRARDLIEQGWSQGSDARDDAGSPVEPWSSAASSWSLLGALAVAADIVADPRAQVGSLRAALGGLAELIDDPSLESWNDAAARTPQEVIDALDGARRACLGAPG